MTEAEGSAIIYRLVEDTPGGMDEAEITRVFEWIQNVKTDSTILELFEQGKVRLYWPEGGDLMIACREPADTSPYNKVSHSDQSSKRVRM